MPLQAGHGQAVEVVDQQIGGAECARRIGVGDGDRAEAGGPCRLEAPMGVFDRDTIGRDERRPLAADRRSTAHKYGSGAGLLAGVSSAATMAPKHCCQSGAVEDALNLQAQGARGNRQRQRGREAPDRLIGAREEDRAVPLEPFELHRLAIDECGHALVVPLNSPRPAHGAKHAHIVIPEIPLVVIPFAERDAFRRQDLAEGRQSAAARCWRSRRRSRKRRLGSRLRPVELPPWLLPSSGARRRGPESADGFRAARSGHS